jgi:hypothetical protein
MSAQPEIHFSEGRQEEPVGAEKLDRADTWIELLDLARQEIGPLDLDRRALAHQEPELPPSVEAAVRRATREISLVTGVEGAQARRAVLEALASNRLACRTSESAIRFLRDLAPGVAQAAEEARADVLKAAAAASKQARTASATARRLRDLVTSKKLARTADVPQLVEAAESARSTAKRARAIARRLFLEEDPE